ELEFTKTALEAIADQAILRRTGARCLRGILEEVLLLFMYDIPSRGDVAKFVITEQTVRDTVNPNRVSRQTSRHERTEYPSREARSPPERRVQPALPGAIGDHGVELITAPGSNTS